MDAFEQVVCEILWMNGYWVRSSVKVDLTKEEKRLIRRPSSPRWELDIVAYQGATNTLTVVECKSYIDSVGVRASAFDGSDPSHAARYKLFNEQDLRAIVFDRLAAQLSETKTCRPNPTIRLALACGKIKNKSDRESLHELSEKQNWILWDERWLREQLEKLATQSYENQVASVVSKLIFRTGN